jgi:hypothetical protein
MSNWRVLGWLGTSLWLLTVTINVLFTTSIQVEGTELNRRTIYLAIAGHADCLLLI